MKQYDVCIIGAGIVGLATALQLSQSKPGLRIAILDKENDVARHQTGNNSGVIHSGIYYKPGSSKALNCARGYRYLLDFAQRYDIPHEICGKVIVATRDSELPQLEQIFERGKANGLTGIRMISAEECREVEPHVAAVKAIRVPQSGIINYKAVAQQYRKLIEEKGGEVSLGHTVTDIQIRPEGTIVGTDQDELQCRLAVNCAGLYSDKIAQLAMPEINLKIIPFRGEYYELVPEKQGLVNHLIYPVPNPNFPFLGVHFTRMIEGGIEAGPNAVLAFKREGYSRYDFDMEELLETLSFTGFQRIALKYWRDGLGELYRSFSKAAFVRALSHLIPEIQGPDLKRGGAGVRAMACGRDGSLIDDFLILEKPGLINVCNAPSPAATASLSIGETIAEKAMAYLSN